MKSKKAREYISKISDKNFASSTVHNFYRIVEIAEEEMRERAIDAFIKLCKDRWGDDNTCKSTDIPCSDYSSECWHVAEFIRLIDNHKTE